jgi:hypothetical protein
MSGAALQGLLLFVVVTVAAHVKRQRVSQHAVNLTPLCHSPRLQQTRTQGSADPRQLTEQRVAAKRYQWRIDD